MGNVDFGPVMVKLAMRKVRHSGEQAGDVISAGEQFLIASGADA